MGINYKIINLTRGQEIHSAGIPWRLSDIDLDIIIPLMGWKETDSIELCGLAVPCNNYIYEGDTLLITFRMEALPSTSDIVSYVCLLNMKVQPFTKP
jgi:hypothetical protein